MTTFKDFDLRPGIQKAIDATGYTEPTQIQTEVWNAAKEWNNIVGQSQTGTGKTTAFLLPLLHKVDNRKRHPQVLIIAPTRELVVQIREDIMKLTEFFPMRSLVLMGGRRREWQKEDLARGPQFIVATPGRLIEFMQEGHLNADQIEYFVMDEVDRMLDMGFIDDVDRIWSQLKNLKQTMTFSATINDEIKKIITKHCSDYEYIRISPSVTVDAIDHTYIELPLEHKFSTLMHLLEGHKNQKTIIFAQTKRNTETITKEINKHGHTAQYLNGDLDQRQRTRALKAFKEGTCKILVTTDVAARGLNMDNVELVVNFEVPREPESYIHRIGRTGRAGAEGKALMLVSPDEKHLMYDIEKTQKIKLEKSADHQSVADPEGKFTGVKLDVPIPPSEKKRRMVERRERGVVSGRKWGNRFSRDDNRSGGRGGRSSGGQRGWRWAGRPRRDDAWTSRSFGNSVGGYQVDSVREQRYIQESKFLGKKAADRSGREFDPHKGRPRREPRPGDSFIGNDRPRRSSGPRTSRGPRTSAPRGAGARSTTRGKR